MELDQKLEALEDTLRRLQTVSLTCEFAFELLDISFTEIMDKWREAYADDAAVSAELSRRMAAYQQRARELLEEIRKGNASVLGD